MIVANADFMGGFALWVDEQRHLHHTYSFLGVETYRQVSSEPLPPGMSRCGCCSIPINPSPPPVVG